MLESHHRAYARRLFFTDTLLVAGSLVASYVVMFEDINLTLQSESQSRILTLSLTPVARAVVMGVAWMLILSFSRSRDRRVIGSGTEEYKRVFNSGVWLLGTLGMAALFFKLDVSRLFVAMSLLVGTFALLISRFCWRKWLRKRRANGIDTSKVAIQGPPNLVEELVEKLRKDRFSIYAPVLLFARNQAEADLLKHLGLQIEVGFDDPATVLDKNGVEGLILLGSDNLSGGELKRVSWNLEKSAARLIVAPGLLEATGPRTHTRPVAGMPLIEIESPTFEGARFIIKQSVDILLSIIFAIILSPVILITALAVKFGDGGPVFFRQERHGRDGQIFHMLKFRSMRVGADKQHEEMKKLNEADLVNTNMLKLPNDPRITKVGKFIRRYSIDELPQLFNVIGGQMSLVGPRPPLPNEVAEYEQHVYRRLLVKPGITGIWQVSGRANLSWEETVRLDLDYVENWSLIGDFVILLKTVGVVFNARGAY